MTDATRPGRLSRRSFISASLVAGAAVLGSSVDLVQAAPAPRVGARSAYAVDPGLVTGQDVPELAAFDDVMKQTTARWGLPGGALAVSRDGRLVFSRGYGLADAAQGQPFEPTSLCRIASDSKPITAIAILRLIEQGKFALTDKAFALLPDLKPPANAPRDPRLDEITIQHLLQHTGGWDSAKSFDPQYPPFTFWTSGVLGVQAPPSGEQIIRFMLAQPLDFAPGARYAYSNFGYNVLGRIIERASGMSYGDYVQKEVLAPAGITGMRLGRTRLDERAPGEVRYVSLPDQPAVPSAFPGEGYVPFAYGGYYLEALDAHGGWIGSAEDQIRFVTAVDGQLGPAILKPESVDAMLRTPVPQETGSEGAGNARSVSGLSWVVQPQGGGLAFSHAGALEGTCASWMIRRGDGTAISFVFNALPTNFPGFFGDISPALSKAADEIAIWPSFDLFASATR